jgi:hypothetical protein
VEELIDLLEAREGTLEENFIDASIGSVRPRDARAKRSK